MSHVAILHSPAPPARAAPRHRWMALSFAFGVLLPTLAAAFYLFSRAADQYGSTVAFSVRTEEFASPVELLGGIAEFASSGSSDADIIYEFMNSQEIVRRIDDRLGLVELYAKPPNDPVFGFESGKSIEDLHAYWSRMVRVVYDRGTGLIEVRTLAFEPEDARSIAAAILVECGRLVEELSAIAQADTTEFARAELARAVNRMKAARESMTTFRSRTQIVDPTADLQGQMGLLSMLEQQLAVALIDTDLLRENTRAQDPRLKQANRRIAVIETRISEERRKLGFGGAGGEGADYAMLLSEFEGLAVDRQFAEESYTGALAAFDQAQAEARRKSRYLAAHVQPTLAETAQYPRRLVLLAMLGFFLASSWAIAVLVFYSLRDRR